MNSPKVSIIVTLYNLGEYIADALNSALQQDYDNFDVYLVNDGSTEELSKERVLFYKSQNIPNLIILDLENQGVVKARNFAASKSDAKYILFLDGDDILRSDYLKKTVNTFLSSKSEKLGFVTTDYQHFGNSSSFVDIPLPNIPTMLVKNSAHTSSLILKDAFESVKGYDIKFTGYMDWDLWLSIIEKGFTWQVIKEPLFNYRVRSGSMVTKSIQNFENLFSILQKKHIKLYRENCDSVITALQLNYIQVFKELDLKNQHIDYITDAFNKLEKELVITQTQLKKIKSKKIYKFLSFINKFLKL